MEEKRRKCVQLNYKIQVIDNNKRESRMKYVGLKDQFYKVMDNPAKYMYKNFRKNIITGSWIRSVLSYDFILNDFMDKNFRKSRTIWQIFGHLTTSEVKGHIYKVVENPLKYRYTNFCQNIKTGSWIIRAVKSRYCMLIYSKTKHLQ